MLKVVSSTVAFLSAPKQEVSARHEDSAARLIYGSTPNLIIRSQIMQHLGSDRLRLLVYRICCVLTSTLPLLEVRVVLRIDTDNESNL